VADERRDRAENPVSRPRSASPSVRNQGVWDAVGELVRQREADLGRPLRVLDYGVADRVTGRQGDADSAADDSGETFDLVCCHGVLEVVDDPTAALAGIAAALTPKGHLSLVVAGRLAAVLAKALAGEIGPAREALTSPDGRWGRADPLPRRFDIEGLVALLDATGFTPVQIHGVRVFTDLVPPAALDSAADREAVAALERAVATHPQYAEALGSLGAGLHAIAQRS